VIQGDHFLQIEIQNLLNGLFLQKDEQVEAVS